VEDKSNALRASALQALSAMVCYLLDLFWWNALRDMTSICHCTEKVSPGNPLSVKTWKPKYGPLDLK
jgi:hypothetical protein